MPDSLYAHFLLHLPSDTLWLTLVGKPGIGARGIPLGGHGGGGGMSHDEWAAESLNKKMQKQFFRKKMFSLCPESVFLVKAW